MPKERKRESFTSQETDGFHMEVTEDMLLAIRKTRGIDTCARLNSLLQFSGVVLYTYVDGVGYMRIANVKQINGKVAEIIGYNFMGEKFDRVIPWGKEFSLFLGEP